MAIFIGRFLADSAGSFAMLLDATIDDVAQALTVTLLELFAIGELPSIKQRACRYC